MSNTENIIIYTDELSLPVGKIHISASNKGLRSLYFISDTNTVADIESKLKKQAPHIQIIKDEKVTAHYIDQIKDIWATKNVTAGNIKLDLQGTAFQKDVWAELLKIESGKTVKYNEVARNIGKPKAVRAAASAIAKNPISILIPCHRVLPKSGGVGNYAGGSTIKEKLLQYEGVI